MSKTDWETAVMALVRSNGYRPVKPRVIARRLAVADDDLQTFKRLIKKMVKRGALVYGANHLIGLPGVSQPAAQGPNKRQGPFITGVFRRVAAGFGFVRPQGTNPAVGRERDLYIAAEHAGDASSGDTVLVRPLPGKGRFHGSRGQIVEVLQRETNRFVGTYFEAAGNALVRVDGTLFSDPIYVGDPGAKNAGPDDKVVFEMVRFPTHAHGGEGVIVEVLGAQGQPGVDTLSIIREFNLPEAFAEDALDAARREAEQFDESLEGRLDLTQTTIITIDPVDARDFDDAISLERLDNGHWRLGVHIADVSHFVKAGGPLDREAHERATSVYLPDRVLPMLPEVISNALASLQPDRVRYAKTVFLEYTADGVRVAADLHNSAIKSVRRFTYEEVDDYLERPQSWRSKLAPEVHALLGRMRELASILRARRIRRGAIEIAMQEVKVDLDRDGRVCGAHRQENTESHRIIEDFMLAANDAVAELLHEAGVPFLRRVHLAPNPIKIRALNEFVAELGYQTDSLESRFELQRLLKEVEGKPEQHAINYAVLRSLQRAVYSPEEEGHYALASDCYCHFTSPIRRYPDLTVHRLVDGLITRRKLRRDFTELVVLGEHCSDRERRAEAAERELTKVKLLAFLQNRIGEEMDALITGVEDFGLFAQGIKLPVEGLIHATSLADDYYYYDKSTHSLVGRRRGNRFRLGDAVRVTVVRVDIDRRELDFRLTQPAAADRRHAPAVDGRAKKPAASKHKSGRTKPARSKDNRGRKKHRRDR